MKKIKKIEEIEKYFDKSKNAYYFIEDNKLIDVKFTFDIKTESNIYAWNVVGKDISAKKVLANKIKCRYIEVDEADIVKIKTKQNLNKMYKIIEYPGNTLMFRK